MPRQFTNSKTATQEIAPFWSVLPNEVRQSISNIALGYGMDRGAHFQSFFKPTSATKDGDFKGYVGNASNLSNEPSFIFVDKDDAIGYETVVKEYNDIPEAVRPKKPLPNESLVGTSYENPRENLGLWTMPIVGYVGFQLEPPTGTLLSDEDKSKAEAISAHVRPHIEFLEVAYEKAQSNDDDVDDIIVKLKSIDKDAFPDYVRQDYDELFHVNDPFVSFSLTNKAIWPGPIAELESFFKPNATLTHDQQCQNQQQQQQQQQQALPRGLFASSAPIVVQNASELDHKTQADEALFGLRCTFIRAHYEAGAKSARNYVLPEFSAGMQEVINAPVSLRPRKLQRLIMSGLQVLPDDELQALNPFYAARNIIVFPLTWCKAILANNFSQQKPLSLFSDATSITYILLGAQNKAEEVARVVAREKKNEVQAKYEGLSSDIIKNNSDELDNLCLVNNMDDLPAFLAHWNFLDEIMFKKSADGRKSIFIKMNNGMMVLQASERFKGWNSANKKTQPQLVFNILACLSSCLSKFAIFSEHSLNIQEAIDSDNENRSLNEKSLVLTKVEQSIQQFARFVENIEGKIADDVPIKDVASITPHDKNPERLMEMERLELAVEKATLAVGGSSGGRSSGGGPPGSSTKNRRKAEEDPPASPTRSNARASKKKKGEKPTAEKDYKLAGMLHSTLTGKALGDWFKGLDLSNPMCPFFMTRRFECEKKSAACPQGKHWHRLDKIPSKSDTTKLLNAALASNGKVWLDEETIVRHKFVLEDKYKVLLGNAQGPKRT